MKLIHTVTLPNGKTAKRVSTSRRYSHAVIARETELSRARAVAIEEQYAAGERSLVDDHTRYEASERGDRAHHEQMLKWSPDRKYKPTYASFEAWRKSHLDSAAHHDKRAAHERTRALRDWSAVSWSGRADLAVKAAAHESHDGRYETRVLPIDKLVEHAVKSRTVAQASPSMSPEARALFDRFVASSASIDLADDAPGFAELLTLKLVNVYAWGGRTGVSLSRHGYNIVKSERGVAAGKLVARGAA